MGSNDCVRVQALHAARRVFHSSTAHAKLGPALALAPPRGEGMSVTRDDLAKLQHAFIRSLSDEVDRCSPSDERAAALREQIREEERLAELSDHSAATRVTPRTPRTGKLVSTSRS